MEEETTDILDRYPLDKPPKPKEKEAPPPKIVIEGDDAPDVVLPLIVLIILIAFLGWMLYLLISSGFQTTSVSDPVTTDQRLPTFLLCATGACATDLISGVKTCPVSENEAISVNPNQSVCNGRFVCDNSLTPFAVQSDESTNINGICEPQVECSCLQVSQCPNYILSAFTTSNGNPYTTFQYQRITFPQISSSIGTDGAVSAVPPIRFTNPSTTFCQAPISWLPFSSPGCNFISGNDVNSITYDDILICTGLSQACNGVLSNPCLQGTLAVITDNPDTLTQENINGFQFGCVAGEPCPCDTLPVYDTNYGGIVCRDIPAT